MFHVRLLSLGTSTLTGTFASPDAVTVPNGAHGFLKLVSSGGLPTDTSPYWARSEGFNGGSASYSIPGMPDGTYTAYAFIDMNGNAPNSAAAMPDSADYFLQTGISVTISGNQVLNLGPSGWTTAGTGFSIVGYWNTCRAYAKYTGVWEFRADGTFATWEDYAGTMPDSESRWSLSGNTLTLTDPSGNPFNLTMTWINLNAGQLSMTGVPAPGTMYRKGSEPDGYLFSNPKYPLMPLSRDISTGGTLASDGAMIFRYVAGPNAQQTVFSWSNGVEVWVYADEQTTAEPGNPRWLNSPHVVELNPGSIYSVVVRNNFLNAGDFTLGVTELSP